MRAVLYALLPKLGCVARGVDGLVRLALECGAEANSAEPFNPR
jgi:hypothetical protein